jgi:membrane protease subunit HflK
VIVQTVREAEGYALGRINHARGDSARFVALYGAYAKAPEVTRLRLYLETMSEILPTVERKVIVDGDLKSVLPLLNLDTSKGGGQK